jgi:chromatin remodeling complex protein RSC6
MPAKKKPAAKKAVKTNAAFMKPLSPSANLAEVVGAKPLSRPELIKKLWAYFKKNGLQDSTDKRMINLDDKLKGVYGSKKQIHMTEVSKAFKHLS